MARELMSPASDESAAVRMVAILRRRALVATVAFMTILAAAVAFAVYLPDLYTASAIVTIERPLPDGVIRTAVSNELESRLYQIRQEVLSRERLTALIKRFDLYPDLRKKSSFEDALKCTNGAVQVAVARDVLGALRIHGTPRSLKSVRTIPTNVHRFRCAH